MKPVPRIYNCVEIDKYYQIYSHYDRNNSCSLQSESPCHVVLETVVYIDYDIMRITSLTAL